MFTSKELHESNEKHKQEELQGIYRFNLNGIHRQSDWSDEIFFTKHYTPAASELRKEISIDYSVNIAKYFLHLYLGCINIPQNVTLQDIYFSILPSIKIGGKYIFDSQQASKEQVSLSLSSTNISSFKFYKCSSPEKPYNTPSGVFTFSAEKIDKWFGNIIRAAEDPFKKQDFINMVGFIMLNMLRLLRNEDESVDRHMPMGAYKSLLKIFKSFQEIQDIPFPPPHAAFYDTFPRTLCSQRNTKHILAIVVQSFITTEDENVLSFLNEACLQHFYGHGIGAINWSSKLADKMGMELNDVLSCFVWENTSISVEKIKLFKSKVQPKSWPWSRFFEDAAYYSLSTAKNRQFCLICAYSVIDDHQRIPNMPQFGKISQSDFDYGSNGAKYLLQLLQQKNIRALTSSSWQYVSKTGNP